MQIAGAIANSRLYATLAKAESELRDKSEQLFVLSNNIPKGLVYQIDSGENGERRSFTYISNGVEQLHGITASEALNDAKIIYGQIIEDDQEELAEQEEKALAASSPFMVEVRRRLPSGDVRWSLFMSAPRRLANNHLVWDRVEVDITERKEAEEALHKDKLEIERLTQEAAIIAEIGRKISSTLNIDEVCGRLAAESRKLISYDRMVVSRINGHEKTYTLLYVGGLDIPERRKGGPYPLEGTSMEAVWKRKYGIIIQGQDEEEVIGILPQLKPVVQKGVLSLLSVPLISNNDVIGSVTFWSRKPHAYTEADLRLAEGIGREIEGVITNAQLYTELDQLNRTLESRVKERTTELEEMNIAFRVLLKKGEQDLKNQQQDIMKNINLLIMPFLHRMQASHSVDQQKSFARIVESNLGSITSPFQKDSYGHLTHMETQVAALIKNGMSSKEIAGSMNISIGTVITHRNKIRRKLKLSSRNINLRTHLLSLSQYR